MNTNFTKLTESFEQVEQEMKKLTEAKRKFETTREESAKELKELVEQTKIRLNQDDKRFEESQKIINEDLEEIDKMLADLLN